MTDQQEEVVTSDDWPKGTSPTYRTETERLAATCREHAPKVVKLKTYADGGMAARSAGTFTKRSSQLKDGVYEFRADGAELWGHYTPADVAD